MKRKNWYHFAVLTMVACLLCSLIVGAYADLLSTSDIEEDSGYMKEYSLPEVGISLKMPIRAQVEVQMDTVNMKAISISLPDQFSDAYFIFFAIYDQELEGVSLQTMDDEAIQRLLSNVSPQPSSIHYTTDDTIIPGMRLLRAPEPNDDYDVEHLIALHNGWVLNAAIARMNKDGTPLDELRPVQEDLMRGVFTEDSRMRNAQTFTLPGSEITLSVPDTLHLRVITEEQNTCEIYVTLNAPGYQLAALNVLAIRKPDYQGKTVATLEHDTVESAMAVPTFSGVYDTDSVSFIQDFEKEQPIVSYQSDETNKHLLGLRDGWALYVTTYPIASYVDADWRANLMIQTMRQLMGNAAPIDDWVPGLSTRQEGDLLMVPLLNRTITIAIPAGYEAQISSDNANQRDISLYAPDNSGKYYSITSTPTGVPSKDSTIIDLYSEEMPSICDSVSKIINDMGFKADSQLSQEGFGGYPSIHSTVEEQQYEQYYGIIDSHMVSVSFTSEGSEITAEESAALMNLIQ